MVPDSGLGGGSFSAVASLDAWIFPNGWDPSNRAQGQSC
jgi:hypothetical protein